MQLPPYSKDIKIIISGCCVFVETHVDSHIRCLVISPTKELSKQITTVFKQFAQHTDLVCEHICTNYFSDAKKKIDVAIATPLLIIHLLKKHRIHIDKYTLLFFFVQNSNQVFPPSPPLEKNAGSPTSHLTLF